MRSVFNFVPDANPIYKLPRERIVGSDGSWEPKAIVEAGCVASQYANMTTDGCIKYMGWWYDFRDELKRYVVRDAYGCLCEMYAPNKTSLRKGFGRRVDYIIEIK